MGTDEITAVSQSEIVAVYPHRWAVPRDTLGHFFGQAGREIGVLVYSGMFIAEDMGVLRLFAERARAGVRVRKPLLPHQHLARPVIQQERPSPPSAIPIPEPTASTGPKMGGSVV
jgi:hypothetical protein